MKKIAIIPNKTKDSELLVAKRIVDILKGRAELFMEKKFEGELGGVCFMGEEIFDSCDCVIVIGGDGTVLQVAEPCGKREIPVMGVNMGKVGFMTETETDQLEEACGRLLSGDYLTEKRMMMSIGIVKDGETVECPGALNDVVISKIDAKMISVELYANENKINAYISDGIIISTPTGSTGYSLSAGGPVADPAMELFIASPICAHMLGSRPAVMPADKEIVLELTQSEATVTVDGVIVDKIKKGDKIVIKKADYSFNLIRMSKYSFYDVLINKLS